MDFRNKNRIQDYTIDIRIIRIRKQKHSQPAFYFSCVFFFMRFIFVSIFWEGVFDIYSIFRRNLGRKTAFTKEIDVKSQFSFVEISSRFSSFYLMLWIDKREFRFPFENPAHLTFDTIAMEINGLNRMESSQKQYLGSTLKFTAHLIHQIWRDFIFIFRFFFLRFIKTFSNKLSNAPKESCRKLPWRYAFYLLDSRPAIWMWMFHCNVLHTFGFGVFGFLFTLVSFTSFPERKRRRERDNDYVSKHAIT